MTLLSEHLTMSIVHNSVNWTPDNVSNCCTLNNVNRSRNNINCTLDNVSVNT